MCSNPNLIPNHQVFQNEHATFERDVAIEGALNAASLKGREAWKELRGRG